MHVCSLPPKENQSLTVVKAWKQILLRSSAVGERRPQFRAGLQSKYSVDKWGFDTEEQGGELWVENY